MVELSMACVEGHVFTQQFPNPVDWDSVNRALKDPAPRCPEHPDRSMYWYDE